MSSFNNPLLERFLQNQDDKRNQANFEAEQNRLRSASEQAFKIETENTKLRRDIQVAAQAHQAAQTRVAEAELKQSQARALQQYRAGLVDSSIGHPALNAAKGRHEEVPVFARGDAINAAGEVEIDTPFGVIPNTTNLGEAIRGQQRARAEEQRVQDFASQGTFDAAHETARAQEPYKIAYEEERRKNREQEETQKFENRKIVSRIEHDRRQSKNPTIGQQTFIDLAASGQLPISKLTPALANQLEKAGLTFIPEKARKDLLEVQETVQIIDMMERLIKEHEEAFGDNPLKAKGSAFWQAINPNSRYNERKAALEARLPQVARIFGEDRLTELDIIRTKGGVVQLYGNSIAQFRENIADLKNMINNKRIGLQGKAKGPQMREHFVQLMSVAEVDKANADLDRGKNNEGLGAGNFSSGERYTIGIEDLITLAEKKGISPAAYLKQVQDNRPDLDIQVEGAPQ